MKRILVPIDGSAAGDAALALALTLARTRGGELLIVHAINTAAVVAECVTPYGGDPSAALEVLESDERDILAEAVLRAQKAGVPATTLALDGAAAEQISELARARRVDAIVMGTSGRRGVERIVAGSVAEGVLRSAPVPVFVVHEGYAPATETGRNRCILVAVDAANSTLTAERVAIDLAARNGSNVVFCHVAGDREESPDALGIAQMLAAEKNVRSTRLTVHGRNTAEVIIATAEASNADLIAVGTHGRRGFDRLVLGSVAEGVVRDSPLPVLVVGVNCVAAAAL